MAKQTINIGVTPNDGSGDSLRTAYSKTNQNFEELYSTAATVTTLAGNVSTGANTTPVDLTGLTWSFASNSSYMFRWIGTVLPAATTTGCGFQVNVSVAVTDISMSFYHTANNSGALTGGASIADDASIVVSSDMPSNSVPTPVVGSGLLRTSSTAGTAQLRFRSETTAVTTALEGMTLVVEKVA